MKILISVANYGQENIGYLQYILNEYNNIGLTETVTVCIDTTVKVEELERYDNVKIIQRIFDSSIKQNLVFEHRTFMKDNLNNYDLFIYTENDILITMNNIMAFVDFCKKRRKKYILGFIRYEMISISSKKYFIDFGKKGLHLPIIKKLVKIDGEDYLEITNIHQACFLLTKEQLSTILNSRYRKIFLRQPSEIAPRIGSNYLSFGYGVLEAGASDIFNNCGLIKIISVKNLEMLLIHHLPNKYCKIFHERNKLDSVVTLEEIRDFKKLMKIGFLQRLFCTALILLRYIRVHLPVFR